MCARLTRSSVFLVAQEFNTTYKPAPSFRVRDRQHLLYFTGARRVGRCPHLARIHARGASPRRSGWPGRLSSVC